MTRQARGPSAPAPLAGWSGPGSPYHSGERMLQERAGARDVAERFGRKGIRAFMPDQHRTFFAQLPFIVIGSLDCAGQAWASILAGEPGFLDSPDPRLLEVRATPPAGDPLAEALRRGAPLGLLGIEFATRRRNRMNGRVHDCGAGGFSVAVDQSFGNCAKYIQARTPGLVARAAQRPPALEGALLSPRAAALIAAADTFFIASASPGAGGGDPTEGVDVNHRGGRAGFVHVGAADGTTVLAVPDFSGNRAFSTFGNIELNPVAGLLFVDFADGDVLILTGTAEVLWDAPELRSFAGAERLLRFRTGSGLYFERALPLSWSTPQEAPQIPATGNWTAAEASG